MGDPVMVRDYSKSQDPLTKGIIVSNLGPVMCRVQVEDFLGKRHVDQLKDLSGTTILTAPFGPKHELLPRPSLPPVVDTSLLKDYPDTPAIPPSSRTPSQMETNTVLSEVGTKKTSMTKSRLIN